MTDKALASGNVRIDLDTAQLEGVLTLPEGPSALVVFAHGSGSSRFSPRNIAVARFLNRAGLATLLFDLLTAEENRVDELTREYRFNITLLSQRLGAVIDWLGKQARTATFNLGLFGASTGAAAALIAAAEHPGQVGAVVSRGGRADLAGPCLDQVQAPTLLIVGAFDREVIALNQQAASHLQCQHRIAIVPGATHLFEETGTLEQVQQLAADWFNSWLTDNRNRAS